MKTSLSLAAFAAFFAMPALAGDAAMEKCLADTAALGADDPEAGCECFFNAISSDAREDYANITDWVAEATDEMKDAGAACFPEIQ